MNEYENAREKAAEKIPPGMNRIYRMESFCDGFDAGYEYAIAMLRSEEAVPCKVCKIIIHDDEHKFASHAADWLEKLKGEGK